jgi:hypothetical protein
VNAGDFVEAATSASSVEARAVLGATVGVMEGLAARRARQDLGPRRVVPGQGEPAPQGPPTPRPRLPWPRGIGAHAGELDPDRPCRQTQATPPSTGTSL